MFVLYVTAHLWADKVIHCQPYGSSRLPKMLGVPCLSSHLSGSFLILLHVSNIIRVLFLGSKGIGLGITVSTKHLSNGRIFCM